MSIRMCEVIYIGNFIYFLRNEGLSIRKVVTGLRCAKVITVLSCYAIFYLLESVLLYILRFRLLDVF